MKPLFWVFGKYFQPYGCKEPARTGGDIKSGNGKFETRNLMLAVSSESAKADS
ncbi:MAG: hypothetical protein LBG72_08070 [Spirochaetaceae bacterium]|nr:hypothetical protein [Spirochaetaceae bacterium]